MKKSLYELALEYEESIASMNECLEKTKKERRDARLAGDTDRYKLLSAKLYTIYEEIRDMKMIVGTLKNYYCDDMRTEACA